MLGFGIFFYVIGPFGNVATFVTLKFEKGLRHFTKIMFCMVTFWDTFFLIVYRLFLFFGTNNSEGSQIKFDLETTFFYLFQISRYCSIWHLSVTALERMFFVVWPTNAIIRRASVKEAVIISFIFILFSVFLNCIPFISLKIYMQVDSYFN